MDLKLAEAWATAEDFQTLVLCLRVREWDLAADSDLGEALEWDLALVEDSDLGEAEDGEEEDLAAFTDILILQRCLMTILMECPMDILPLRAMAILTEWVMSLSILHKVLPKAVNRKNKKVINPCKRR